MKKFLFSRAFIILLLFLLVLAGYRFYSNQKQINQMQQEISNLEMEISRADEANHKLQESLEEINSLEYIEEVARTKLGLVKPGEMLVIPVDETSHEEDDNN